MHVMILPQCKTPVEDASHRTKRRRLAAVETVSKFIGAPPPPLPPVPKLIPEQTSRLRMLSGQMPHTQLRKLRSYLNSIQLNFLSSDPQLRSFEAQLRLPLEVDHGPPTSIRLTDLTQPLTDLLLALHSKAHLVPPSLGPQLLPLSLQLQVDKGGTTTKGLLKIVNVLNGVPVCNILPLFLYVGDENYGRISSLIIPLLEQLFRFQLPPPLAALFSCIRLYLSADIKCLQTMLGLTPSSSSRHPCPFCLIPREQLRQPGDVTATAEPRSFLQHMTDYFRLQNEHSGNPAMALQVRNVQAPPPFLYNVPGPRTVTLGMPVLHVSIGLGTKLLYLVGALAADANAFTRFLLEHKLNYHEYHGGTLAGQQVHDLLADPAPKYHLILEAIRHSAIISISSSGAGPSARQEPSEHFDQMRQLFHHFATAYRLYTLERFLTAEEIEQLEDACHSFARKFREWYQGESITPKLHILAVEIPQFARFNRTVGLFSEQRIESFHAEVNKVLTQLDHMGDTTEKYIQLFHDVCRRYNPLVPSFSPPQRLCGQCQQPLAGNKQAHEACRVARTH